MKKKLVILSFYLPGIYPQGDDSVVLNLLAPAYLKAALDSEPKLSEKYEKVILDDPTTTCQEEILKEIVFPADAKEYKGENEYSELQTANNDYRQQTIRDKKEYYRLW